MSKWSVRTINTKKGQYALVTGKAYPQVKAGKNETNQVKAPIHNRQAYYHDPAVQLSEADLDAIEGAAGAPLCVEHNKEDVVGHVHHSWIDEDNGRCLSIIGRIPMNDRGKKVVDDIKSGKFKGFSVGYGTRLQRNGTGGHELEEKTFHEISLVEEPFFNGCDLTVGVMASKKGNLGNNFVKLLYFFVFCNDFQRFSIETSIFVPIQMSETQQPPQPQTITPQANPEAETLLKQADILKEQQMEAAKALEKERQDKALLEKEVAHYRAKAAAEAAKYKEAQEPKYKEFIEQLQITAGKTLPEAKLKQYHTLFTDPDFKDDADVMFAAHRETVELKASAKLREEELAKERAEKAKLNETLTKASQQVGSMRASYASAVAPAVEEPARKEVGVSASLKANEILCAAPSAAELPFLQKYGFSNEVNVNASGSVYGQQQSRPLRVSIAAPREHRLLYDEDGDLQFPQSARYTNPARFAWMVNEAPFQTMDLTEHVAINASGTFLEPKRVE